MKKLLIIFLSLILCIGIAGCGTSKKPTAGNDPENPGTPVTPGNPTTPGEGDSSFSVRLVSDGQTYFPQTAISAQWFNGESLYTAEFENGVATIYGLDGDYQVTLTDVPQGYTYDPNNNFATNKNKDIEIELLSITPIFGNGTGLLNNAYTMSITGAYKVTFSEAGQSICCKFYPPERGSYVIESIMDITANEVNPRLEAYGQNPQYVPEFAYETCKDGGAAAAYTRNFRYVTDIDGDCLNFALRCDSRVGYPVDVYFTIEYADDYSRDPVYEMKIPEQLYDGEGNLKVSPEGSGTYVKCGKEAGNTFHVLDASKFALGDDGYYHLKDDNGNLTSTILYADLTHFNGSQWIQLEDQEGYYVPTNLKVDTYDYTYFIKGWAGLLGMFITEANIPEKYLYLKDGDGYNATRNSDGKCAVTQEMRDFLQAYCVARQLFFDGNGSAEHEGYNSTDDDQWLYYCGYYQ